MQLLNLISSNFGTNWFQSLVFTLLAVSATLYYYFTSLGAELVYDFGQIWHTLNQASKILNLSDWKVDGFNQKFKEVGLSTLFLGRIFIGYGVYQTIQAFRKYGRI